MATNSTRSMFYDYRDILIDRLSLISDPTEKLDGWSRILSMSPPDECPPFSKNGLMRMVKERPVLLKLLSNGKAEMYKDYKAHITEKEFLEIIQPLEKVEPAWIDEV